MSRHPTHNGNGAPRIDRRRERAAPRLASCLYEGSVRHRRWGRGAGQLDYPLFMAYLDLDELPQLFDPYPLWSARRPAVAWFRRADHLGDPDVPLADAVRTLVARHTGARPDGPIRLLTHLRHLGHCFNPVSFYYCFDAGDRRVTAVIADVINTPWGERHAHVMPVEHTSDHGSVALISGRLAKELRVSPLMGMDHVYDLRVTEPAERLAVHVESRRRSGERVFDATLALRRREITDEELARVLRRYPLLSLRMLARVGTEALRLRLRGADLFPRPRRGAIST